MGWIGGVFSKWFNDIIAPFRKDSPLISPLHPLVAMIYLGVIGTGRIYLTGRQESQAMTDMIGASHVSVWATVMSFGGLLAFIGVLRATIGPSTPRSGLTMETWGCVLIFVTQAMYVWALERSDSTAYHTIILTGTIAAAAGLRLVVNVFEYRKIRWREVQTASRIDEEV